jgi:DNA-binding XRE family transcriptional regulator
VKHRANISITIIVIIKAINVIPLPSFIFYPPFSLVRFGLCKNILVQSGVKVNTPFWTILIYILEITLKINLYIKKGITIKMYNRIRELREDHDLTQSDLSKILNMSQTGYSKYEVGAHDIPTKILIVLAEFYNTSIDYILGVTDELKPYPKK